MDGPLEHGRTLNQTLQFKILYRDFLVRLVDLEIVSSGAEAQNLLIQFASLLGAVSFVFALMARAASNGPLTAHWGFEEFLSRGTTAVVGLFTVLAWNALLPERRDSVILGPLPVRIHIILLAKTSAIATALGGAVIALNVFVGFIYPLNLAHEIGAIPRYLLAYWITAAAAGIFTFCAMLAAQGIVAQLFSHRQFLRISAFLQMAALLLLLGSFFLAPAMATIKLMTAPQNRGWMAVLPSYWFLGLFESLTGRSETIFHDLAARGLRNLAVVASIAAVTYALAWSRNLRRIVEEPDIAPSDRSRKPIRVGTWLASKLLPRPLDRVILLFIGRTIARSRQHRLILAVFGGVGLPLSFAYIRSFLTGTFTERWDTPTPPMVAVSLMLMVFAVAGARAAFSLPLALKANWIFRLTTVFRPGRYFTAVRQSVQLLVVAPVLVFSACFYLVIWPPRTALEHMLLLGLMTVALVETIFHQFRKIPFTCSYLPGGSNLRVTIGVYIVALLIGISIVSTLEVWILRSSARWIICATLLLGFAIRARRRNREYDASPYNCVQFDDLPEAAVSPLDLRQDGIWSSEEAWAEMATPEPELTRRQRLVRVAVAALAFIIIGAIYERTGRWLDHRRFPQIGESVNVGGRSINVYCSGSGSPTVVFESGHTMPGYSWVRVQREIAEFTRACWYDRAGYGWSDLGTAPNWGDTISRDLHTALNSAHVPPPYVLVAHSVGGFYIRVYRNLYPNEVAGMVFVDALHEDDGGQIQPLMPITDGTRRTQETMFSAAGALGLVRLLSDEPERPRSLTSDEWRTISALQRQIKSHIAVMRERPFIASARQAHSAGGFGDTPVVVLTAGLHARQRWVDLQAKLAQLSTHGRQEVLVNSGHMIPYEEPSAIVDAVREVIAQVPH